MPATRSKTPALPAAFDVTFVVDRSGSMHCVGNAMREGTAELLEKHARTARRNPEIAYHMRIVSFDNAPSVLYDGPAAALITDEGTLDTDRLDTIYAGLAPRGRTRLIATLAEEVQAQQGRASAWRQSLPCALRRLQPPFGLVFAALTDGIDNVGGDLEQLVDVVTEHQCRYAASCQFIAANQCAEATGSRFGFPKTLCLQMDADPGHARAAMSCLNNSAMRTLTGEIPDFSQLERQMSSQPLVDEPAGGNPFFGQIQRM